MVVEPAGPATAAAIVTASAPANIALLTNSNTGDGASGRHSVTTEQVNDFFSSYAGSNCGSEEDLEDEVPDEKQVDLGNVYSQCRAAREAAFVSTVLDISCNETMLGTETKKGTG